MEAKDAAPQRRKATRRRACPVDERASARSTLSWSTHRIKCVCFAHECGRKMPGQNSAAAGSNRSQNLPSPPIESREIYTNPTFTDWASDLPRLRHVRPEAIRLRSQECGRHSTFLRWPHIGRGGKDRGP